MPAIFVITLILILTACGGVSAPNADTIGSGAPNPGHAAVEQAAEAANSNADVPGGSEMPASSLTEAAQMITGAQPSAGAAVEAVTSLENSLDASMAGQAPIVDSGPTVDTGATESPDSPSMVSPASAADGPSIGDIQTESTLDFGQVFAQAMSSPALLRCLSGEVGMATLSQLTLRAPTGDETQEIYSCLEAVQTPTAPASGSGSGSSSSSDSGEAPAPTTLLEKALASPGLMWCLTADTKLDSLLLLNESPATSLDSMTRQRCAYDTQNIAMWDEEWPRRVDAAFTDAECPAPAAADLPATSYSGPLIDSHFHFPQLPDDAPDAPDDNYQASRGAESHLYDTIAEEDRPLLGRTVDINTIACTLQYEGTAKAFYFFPTFPEITSPAIDVAYRTVEKYPSQILPFIQASANGSATLEGDSLEVMLGVRPDFFFGFGDVGDSPTESINPLPDSEIYTGDFEVARDHGLVVYFHTGVGHQENIARALERFPEVDFIIHGDFVRPHVDDLMDRYPNVYFTYNDIFDEIALQFRFGSKEDFMDAMRDDWDSLLDQAYEMYQPLIEAHPDRYMWGTDRGDIVWNYDPDVGKMLADYGRAFIGRFDPETQALIAYQNAERLIGDYGR